MKIVCIIPPGLSAMIAHHEATSGMGALIPAATAQRSVGNVYPPQTVATCIAAARAAGIDTSVLDGTYCRAPVEFARAVATADGDILAMLVSQGTALSDANFLRLLRQVSGGVQRAHLLLFGPSAHFVVAPLFVEGLAAAAVLGEPEGAVVEAARLVAAGQLSGVVTTNALRPELYSASGLLSDLDALPFPAWDAVPWQPYEMVSMLSSRGCPAPCRYCAYTVVQGHCIRTQSVERTLAEWEWVTREVRPPYLVVRDPVFAAERARVVALCEGIIRRGVRLEWACESRPEHFDRELLRLLKDAGCATVKIGMESGDPALLQTIGRLGKNQRSRDYTEQVRRVAVGCKEAGIRCRVFVMVGLPGQTKASLAQTEAALRHLVPEATIHAKPYHSYPGIGLPGPSASGGAEALEGFRSANRPRASLWRRVYRRWRGISRTRAPGDELAHNRQTAPERTEAPAPTSLGQVFSWQETRVFLTGGNGFLGGHIARALVAAGAHVVALVRPESALGALAELPVQVVRGDLVGPMSWQEALQGCEFCFHVAALYGVYGGAEEAEQMYTVNAQGTAMLMAACAAAGIRRVVHTSTVGTVGRPSDGSLPDEATPFNLWDQASHYVRSKYLGELIAQSWCGAGLDIVVVKPTAPVGAGDARPSATGRRIVAALRGQVTAYPAGGVNHVPVTDAAAGHLLAAVRGVTGQTYILGHPNGNLDHAAFLGLVAEAANRSPLPAPAAWSGPAGGLPDALTVNPARAIRELGLPQSDLRAAFAEAVAWQRAHIGPGT